MSKPIGYRNKQFVDLINGIDPVTCDKLRTIQKNSVDGYDFTFSAPKSVSVVWSQVKDDARHAIAECHNRAVKKALLLLEEHIFTREKKTNHTIVGGEKKTSYQWVQVQSKPVFAIFHHETSRGIDPQLHDHVFLLNTVLKPNGKAGAIDARAFFSTNGEERLRFQLGDVYRSELRRELEETLHFPTIRKEIKNGASFEIKGVPESLLRELSSRSAAINEAVEKSERELSRELTGKERQKIVYETREEKGYVERSMLFARWKEAGTRHGFDPSLLLNRPPPRVIAETRALTRAVSQDIARVMYEPDYATRTYRAGVSRDEVRGFVRQRGGRFRIAR